MDTEPKHTKIKTFTPQPDGSMMIETESYHEKLSGYKQEIEKKTNTSRSTLLNDLLKCLDPMTSKQTREVCITIKSDDFDQPRQIISTYTVKKETYKKR